VVAPAAAKGSISAMAGLSQQHGEGGSPGRVLIARHSLAGPQPKILPGKAPSVFDPCSRAARLFEADHRQKGVPAAFRCSSPFLS